MKAIILAAGIGSRLDNSAHHQPKALTTLANGKTILQNQLDALARHLSMADVRIVVGYSKESIISAFPHITNIFSPNYAEENTAKSLLRALDNVEEDVLWLNGDVVFNPSAIDSILAANCTGMVVNTAAIDAEAVKYRTDKQGRILEVSKQVKKSQGEAVGINFFKHVDIPALKLALTACLPTDYFEKAIEFCIHQGTQVQAITIDNQDCVEVDFPEDLIKANKLLQRWM